MGKSVAGISIFSSRGRERSTLVSLDHMMKTKMAPRILRRNAVIAIANVAVAWLAETQVGARERVVPFTSTSMDAPVSSE